MLALAGGGQRWTEVTGARLSHSVLTVDDPITARGHALRLSCAGVGRGFGGGYGRATATAQSVTAPAENPVVALTAPDNGYPLEAGPVTISGTSSDSGSGVANVQVRIQRSGDGKYWNGSTSGPT